MISSLDRVKTFVATGNTNPVSLNFPFAAATDIVVTARDGDAMPETLELNVDYSIGGTVAQWRAGMGTIVPIAMAAGLSIRAERQTALGQTYDPQGGIPLDHASLEAALDNATMRAIDSAGTVADLLSRAAVLPIGESAGLLPMVEQLKGKFPSIDADGRWYAASGTGNDPDLRADLADEALGAALVVDMDPGDGAEARSQHDINRDFLHAKTFGVKANDGVTDETAQMKNAIASAILQKKVLHFEGDVVVSDSLLTGALVNNLKLRGSGEASARIINKCVGKPCLNIGNSYYLELSDFALVGNGLTGVAGNGHGIDMRDPNFNSGTFLPGFTTISRVSITGHRGVGKAYDGTDIDAWGVYMSNALQSTLHKVYTENNTGGIYAFACFEPTFDTCVFNGNRKAGLVIDSCEAAFVGNPNCVGANDQDSGGVIHLTTGGKSTGGFNARAGAVIDCYSSGTRIVGGKYKNHKYTAICLYSPAMTSVVAPWVRVDTDEGVTGIYNALGAHILNPVITYSGAAVAINRFGIVAAPQQGYRDFGTIEGARFFFSGNGKFGHGIYVNGSLSSFMQGRIHGCRAGDAGGVSGVSTLDAFIRVNGQARGVSVRDNHCAASNNMTVAVAYKLDEVSAVDAQGLYYDNNTTDTFGGAGTITAVKAGTPLLTGLQADGKFEAPNGFKVANQQVVGARDTGWTAATGAANKGAYAAAAAGAVSAGYVQAEAQSTRDRVAAAEARIVALEAMLRQHGLMN